MPLRTALTGDWVLMLRDWALSPLLSPDPAVILSVVWCLPSPEWASCSKTQHDDKIFYLCFMKDSLKMDNLDNLRSMEHPFLMFLAPRASNLLQMQTAAQILQTAAVLQRVMTHCSVWPTLRAHYFNIGDTVHQPHQPEHDQNIKIWINLTLVWTTKAPKNAQSKKFAVYTFNLCH